MPDPITAQPVPAAPAKTVIDPAVAAADRGSFLADLAAAKAAAPDAPAAPAVAVADESVVAAGDSDADLDDAGEDDADADVDVDVDPVAAAASPDDDPDADLDDEDDGDALAKAAKADPELARRFGVLQKHEQRQRAALERDRATFDRERATWAEQAKSIATASKRFESIAGRIEADPVGVLEELGVSPASYETIFRTIFAATDAGKGDPKNAAYAAQLRAKSVERGELAELKAEQQKLKAELDQSRVAAQQERALDEYFGRVSKSVTERTPLLQKLITTNPAKAKAELAAVTYDLMEQNGQMPAERTVVVAYEKKRRAELRELGLDPKAIAAKPPAAPAAAAKKPAAKVAPVKVAPAVPAVPAPVTPAAPARETADRSRDPHRDAFLAEMAKVRATATN